MTRASVNYRYCGFVLPSRCLRAMDRTGDSFVCEAVYHIDCRLYACTYHATCSSAYCSSRQVRVCNLPYNSKQCCSRMFDVSLAARPPLSAHLRVPPIQRLHSWL